MGAVLEWYVISADTRDDVRTEHAHMKSSVQQAFNYDGYSGTPAEDSGLEFVSETVQTEDQAMEIIEGLAEKWGPSIAVRVEEPDGPTYYILGGVYSC